jgi:hypothetical protein
MDNVIGPEVKEWDPNSLVIENGMPTNVCWKYLAIFKIN